MKPVELAFQTFGAPSDPPLLIFHGLFASSRNWHLMAAEFAARFHVFTFDLRGHGASPHARPLDYPHMAADILAFLDAHGLDRASLIGHSMGGKVAMWLALEAPQRVDRLVVADIAPVTYGHSYADTLLGLKRLPLAEIRSRKDAETRLAEAIPDIRIRQFLLQNLVLKHGTYHWRIDLDLLQDASPVILGFPEADAIKRFEGRTLFLAGEHSSYIQPKHLPVLHRLFPNARIETLPGAGHWVHADHPERFAASVMDFLTADGASPDLRIR